MVFALHGGDVQYHSENDRHLYKEQMSQLMAKVRVQLEEYGQRFRLCFIRQILAYRSGSWKIPVCDQEPLNRLGTHFCNRATFNKNVCLSTTKYGAIHCFYCVEKLALGPRSE